MLTHVLEPDEVDAPAVHLLVLERVEQDYDVRIFLDDRSIGSLELARALDDGESVGKEGRDDVVEKAVELLLGDGAIRFGGAEVELCPDERLLVTAVGCAAALNRAILLA